MLGISSIGNYYLDTEESLFFIEFFFFLEKLLQEILLS